MTVFSWPEPVLYGEGKAYFMFADKYAYLENSVSLPSDDNGIAVFKNLTIKGATSKYIYLFLNCDNKIVIFLNNLLNFYIIRKIINKNACINKYIYKI